MEGGETGTQLHQLHDCPQEFIRVAGYIIAHRQRGLIHLHFRCCLKHHVGHIVDRVLAVLVDSAATDIGEGQIACGYLRRRGGVHLALLSKFDPAAIQQFLRLIGSDPTGVNICLVIRIQELIRTSDRICGRALLHEVQLMIHPHGLHRFPEVSGGLGGHTVTNLGDLQQFVLTLLISGLSRLTASFFSITGANRAAAFSGHQHGIQIVVSLPIVVIHQIQAGLALLDALDNSLNTFVDDLLEAGTRIAGATDDLAVNVKGIIVCQQPALLGLLLLPKIIASLAAPVRFDEILEELLVFIFENKGVITAGRNGVKFVFQNRRRCIRTQRAGTRLACMTADNQFIGQNVACLLKALLAESLGLLHDPRLTLGFHKAFRQQAGTL